MRHIILIALLGLVVAIVQVVKPPLDYESALLHLVDGDADRARRRSCLEVLVRQAPQRVALGDPVAVLVLAMARIEQGELTADLPYVPATGVDPVALQQASLGQPHLRSLLLGCQARALGRDDLADGYFAAAQTSALLLGHTRVVELAARARRPR